MKFRGHETYAIRGGWLSKGMRNVVAHPDVFVTKDKDRRPMDVLGVGANMVKALRYWLKATGLTEEPKSGKRVQTLTEFGKLVFENDRYIDEWGTLWFLHYKLSSNKDEATAWYYFFNEFNMFEFTRDDFVGSINAWTEKAIATRSLEDDFNCLIKTYLLERKKQSPENNLRCPLSELNLINRVDAKTFTRRLPGEKEINIWVLLAVLFDQLPPNKNEVTLAYLLRSPCNIGRTFCLDSITMRQILYQAQVRTGLIELITTEGIDCVRIKGEFSFLDGVKKYYETLI